MRKLRLLFSDDHDGTGELRARVVVDEFSGESAAYFNVEEIEEFAKVIAVYPLAKGIKHSISGGFAKREETEELENEHLAIVVYPIDERGHIGVQVRLASKSWPDTRVESQQIAKVEIITTYAPLAKFSAAILKLLSGSREEVVLEGETLL
jgi:hypothetical protein